MLAKKSRTDCHFLKLGYMPNLRTNQIISLKIAWWYAHHGPGDEVSSINKVDQTDESVAPQKNQDSAITEGWEPRCQ
jgi:hypothetical protein